MLGFLLSKAINLCRLYERAPIAAIEVTYRESSISPRACTGRTRISANRFQGKDSKTLRLEIEVIAAVTD